MYDAVEKARAVGIKIDLTSSQNNCFKELENRLQKLKDRSNLIGSNIQNLQSTKTYTTSLKNNFLVKDKIQDFLYENDVLERYLRSEAFKEYDESICCLRFKMENLSVRKINLNMVLEDLEREEK